MSSEQSQVRTHMFARLLGPYFTIVPATVGVREAYMRTLFTEFKANPMWPWLYGAILLMLGLVTIAFHQYWRSPAAVIVSVVGWLLAIRGVILLVVPQAYTSVGNAVEGGSGGQALVRVLAICLALAGLYLTYVGWIAKPRRPESAEGSPREERLHAAGD
jgi:protein-S-isoprenylcysteine O-methyltransferase Ste14